MKLRDESFGLNIKEASRDIEKLRDTIKNDKVALALYNKLDTFPAFKKELLSTRELRLLKITGLLYKDNIAFQKHLFPNMKEIAARHGSVRVKSPSFSSMYIPVDEKRTFVYVAVIDYDDDFNAYAFEKHCILSGNFKIMKTDYRESIEKEDVLRKLEGEYIVYKSSSMVIFRKIKTNGGVTNGITGKLQG